MPEYILGIDGGQTSTKYLIATLDGHIVWSAVGASALHEGAEDFKVGVERRLTQTVQEILSTAQWDGTDYEAAVLGMSGAEPGSPLISAYQSAVQRAVKAKRYSVVHDAVTNLFGASAGQPGIAMIAGGGAVAYGVTADGRTWTTSGWGYVIGDEGSGYNVGRAAINSVFRAFDKRDPPTRLTNQILQRLRVSSPVELKYAIFEGRISFQDIADLTSLVARTALEGDAASRRILEGAGHNLAEAVIAVARALDIIVDPVDIYPTGGLFQESQYLVPAFNCAVSAALPQARIRQPAFEPVVGTLFLAFRELGREIDGALLARLTDSWEKVRWEMKEIFGDDA